MSNFKFKKEEGLFKWESDFMLLEFSNPTIQGFSDFINLTNEKEIMYYYYTVKIFKKNTHWDDEDNELTKLTLVSERTTHDFPCITQLKWILDFQLKDDTKIDGQKIIYYNNKISYSKTFSTEGFACDDFYELTKIISEEEIKEQFVFYCGNTFDYQGDLNSVGVRTPYVERADIEELLACVSGFISFSLEKHNEEIKLISESFKIDNDKIYEYSLYDDHPKEKSLEAIYIVGDSVNIKTVVDNKEYDYDNVTITDISKNTIYLSNESVLLGETIAYIHSNIPKEKLIYNENQICEDFLSVLSFEEKNNFKTLPLIDLLKKYKMAIINRTCMCREEHNFNIDYTCGDRVNMVTPIVENVILKIKEKLKKGLV